jgi:hypothetical protein
MNAKTSWRKLARAIDNYILVGADMDGAREKVLSVLEHVQRLLTPPPQAQDKKQHRILRVALPNLVCLIIGCFLFLPAQQAVQASSATVSSSNVQVSEGLSTQTKSVSSANIINDDPCTNATPTTAPDPITGLPLPITGANGSTNGSGNDACPVDLAANNIADCTNFPAGKDWLLGSSGLLVNTTVGMGTGTNTLQTYWGDVLAIVIALLGIPLIFAGYQIMLGVTSTRYAGAIQIISRIILVTFAAAASYALIQMFISLESGIATSLHTAFGGTSFLTNSGQWQCNTQQFFANIYNITAYNLQFTAQQISADTYATDTYQSTLSLVGHLSDYVLTMLSILLVVQALIRLALINFYIILSPLAIAGGTLPGELGSSAARAWIKGLMALLFVQLLQVIVITIGGQLFPASLTSGSDWMSAVLTRLWPIIIMMIALNIPRLFNLSATTMLSTITSSMGGAMTGVILIVRGL